MTTEAMADMANHREIEQATIAAQREWEATYTLDRQIALARQEMGEQKWNELNAEWLDGIDEGNCK